MVDVDKIIKEKETQYADSKSETDEVQVNMQKDIQENVQENIQEQNKDNNSTQTSLITKEKSRELTDSIETPKFKPQLDTTKTMQDQAGEVINILGAQRASQDDAFMEKVSQNFQKGVLTDQETINIKKQRLKEEQYFLKWQDVLQFAFIKSPHGLTFMYIMTAVAMLVYIPLRILGMAVKAIGTLGEFLNDIFNSIFGGKGKYLRDKEGNVVIDPVTKKPYKEKEGYNLFAKLLFGIIICGLALVLICVFVKIFSGFDIFAWLRNIVTETFGK